MPANGHTTFSYIGDVRSFASLHYLGQPVTASLFYTIAPLQLL